MKKSDYITVRTTKEIKEYLTQIANKEDRTISYIVNRILEDHIKKENSQG